MTEPESESRESTYKPWQWKPERNPYLHNAFTFLRLDDPCASDSTFVAALKQLQDQIGRGEADDVFGCTPVEADLAVIRLLQMDTNLLSQEQLLAHTRHLADREPLETHIQFFSALDVGKAEAMLPLPVVNVAPIASRLPEPKQPRAETIAAPNLAALEPLLQPDPDEEDVLPR